MLPLFFIGLTILLLVGFFALTNWEARSGMRLFAAKRARLDEAVEKTTFVLQHVDLEAFLRSEIRRLVARLGHDAAHLSLQVVRAIERLLTRFVRYIRSRHGVDTAPRGNVREFVKTLSDFKDSIKGTYPEAPKVP